MKIGIIGAGMVGENFGQALLQLPTPHTVMMSSREPESPKMQALAHNLGVQVGTVAQTVEFGDVLVMALRWDAIPSAVAQTTAWSGKVLIDLTNRFGATSGMSGAEELATLTHARVIKAFNTIGAEHYLKPILNGEKASMLFTSDDSEAKAIVSELAQGMGFEPVDAGALSASRLLENMAELWVHLAIRTPLGRNFGFRVARG